MRELEEQVKRVEELIRELRKDLEGQQQPKTELERLVTKGRKLARGNVRASGGEGYTPPQWEGR